MTDPSQSTQPAPATLDAALTPEAATALNAIYDRLHGRLNETLANIFEVFRSMMETQIAAGAARLTAPAPAQPVTRATNQPPPATENPTTPEVPQTYAKPALRGPVFSGDKQGSGHEVHSWASRMDDHLRLNGQLETTLGPIHVGQCREGSAQTWYHSRKTAAGSLPPFPTWRVMRAELIREFAYVRSGRDAFRQLQKLEQRNNSVREYTKRFRNLVMLVDPETCSDKTQLELYLSGLRSDLRGFVESQTPETMERAISSAEALDQCFSRRPEQPRLQEGEQRDARAARPPRNQRDERPARFASQPRFEPRRFQASPRPERSVQLATRGPTPMELGAMRTPAGRNLPTGPARAPARQGN